MMMMIMIKRMMLFTVITKRRSEATVKENQTKMGNQKTYNIGPFVQNYSTYLVMKPMLLKVLISKRQA